MQVVNDQEPGVGRGPDYQVQALVRGLEVLQLVAAEPETSLSEVARKLQLSVSQAFRLLATLEAQGYVSKRPGKRYVAGPAALVLGHWAVAGHPLRQLAAAVLDRLADQTRESVHLVVREGLSTVIADVRESPQAVQVVSPLGKRGALHVGASGKLFLAFESPSLLEKVLAAPLERFAPSTTLEPGALRAELRRVAEQGVCLAIDDFEPGAYAIGAPIFAAGKRILAALAVAGPVSRLTSEAAARYTSLVRAAAGQLSAALGGDDGREAIQRDVKFT
jgi:DNA-binding IclR family transcriptional regulator